MGKNSGLHQPAGRLLNGAQVFVTMPPGAPFKDKETMDFLRPFLVYQDAETLKAMGAWLEAWLKTATIHFRNGEDMETFARALVELREGRMPDATK